MVRTFVVRQDTDLRSLSATLLDARFGEAQAGAAVERLRALNPHADLDRLTAGTTLFVPDAPGFKGTAGTPVQSDPFGEFRALAARALEETAGTLKAGSAARAAERADLAATLKSAAFRRSVEGDRDIARQVEDATKSMAGEAKEAKEAEEAFARMSRAALSALSRLGR